MKKPASLRDHITKALPDLAINPDQLLVFIDEGSLAITGVPGLSFEYRYTLNLVLTDFAGDPDTVMVPLLEWLFPQQNELLANPERRGEIQFEVDILANDKVDLSIKLPLTERVGVRQRAEGGYEVTHSDEPGQIW